MVGKTDLFKVVIDRLTEARQELERIRRAALAENLPVITLDGQIMKLNEACAHVLHGRKCLCQAMAAGLLDDG